ncbi:MAG: hypothetical protein JO025_04460 [Verrucomicrobia bacterium]|nr:hypothetical protein [Verrucomicrobiota bacterium]
MDEHLAGEQGVLAKINVLLEGLVMRDRAAMKAVLAEGGELSFDVTGFSRESSSA